MANHPVLVDICEAMELLNGVSVADSFIHSAGADIDFTVTSSLSRLVLLQVAEAANINLNIRAQCPPSNEEAKANSDKPLFYRFSIESGDIIDALKWLGAHLSWQLLACGIIDARQEKILCRKFGAKSRSA